MQDPEAGFRFRAGDDAARHYWYLPETSRPASARCQWLRFRFRPDDFARHSPASHFAIVLRARLGFDGSGTPVSISGRGITLGDTSQAQPAHPLAFDPAFGGARGAQIESFWPGGNFLYHEAALLPQGLQDGIEYTVRIEVDDARRIELRIDDAPPVAVVDRAAHPVIEGATGVLIALGRGAEQGEDWQASFRDIASGWR
jgi:hypothetical protein